MRELYAFATGPMVWMAFAIFILGALARLGMMYSLAKKKDGPFLTYMSWGWSLRSIFHWLLPYGSLGWRENPLITAVTFIFHLCLIIAPIFTLGHIVLWSQNWGIEYAYLPDIVVDIMAGLVVLGGLFFAVRRLTHPTVRFVSSGKDWWVLIIAVLPFLTGLLARYHVGPALLMTTLHVLSGELMLIAIPFTRLSHMVFGLFSRAYIGSEFGGVRHSKDW